MRFRGSFATQFPVWAALVSAKSRPTRRSRSACPASTAPPLDRRHPPPSLALRPRPENEEEEEEEEAMGAGIRRRGMTALPFTRAEAGVSVVEEEEGGREVLRAATLCLLPPPFLFDS